MIFRASRGLNRLLKTGGKANSAVFIRQSNLLPGEMTDTERPDVGEIDTPTYPDMVNSIGFVGDFGYSSYEGPFPFEMEGGIWTVEISTDQDDYGSLKTPLHERLVKDRDGDYAVAIADGEMLVGGKCISAHEPEGEGVIVVAVDSAPDSDVTG